MGLVISLPSQIEIRRINDLRRAGSLFTLWQDSFNASIAMWMALAAIPFAMMTRETR